MVLPPRYAYVIQMTMPAAATQLDVRRSCAVAVIASAGGIHATIELLSSLPKTFSPPIIIAQHLPRVPSSLDRVLSWRTGMKVRWAEHGDEPQPGHVYLAEPGSVLRLSPEGFRVTPLGPNAASWLAFPDILLESMAETYRSRSVAIILSGMLATGLKGLKRVRACGGIAMAQSAASSLHFDMPLGAIDWGKTEIITSPANMAMMLEVISEQWEGNRTPPAAS